MAKPKQEKVKRIVWEFDRILGMSWYVKTFYINTKDKKWQRKAKKNY